MKCVMLPGTFSLLSFGERITLARMPYNYSSHLRIVLQAIDKERYTSKYICVKTFNNVTLCNYNPPLNTAADLQILVKEQQF